MIERAELCVHTKSTLDAGDAVVVPGRDVDAGHYSFSSVTSPVAR